MSGLDWKVTAISASAAVIAVLIAVARGLRRRRRRRTARAHHLGERRIEVVAINDAGGSSKQDPHP